MYSRVPECQITTYYYVGFAYLMMRRYQDAIRVFANILLYIQRTRNMFQRSTYKYEMVCSYQSAYSTVGSCGKSLKEQTDTLLIQKKNSKNLGSYMDRLVNELRSYCCKHFHKFFT